MNINETALFTSIYLTGAYFAWRWLHTRALTKWFKALLWVTVIWGIAGGATTVSTH